VFVVGLAFWWCFLIGAMNQSSVRFNIFSNGAMELIFFAVAFRPGFKK